MVKTREICFSICLPLFCVSHVCCFTFSLRNNTFGCNRIILFCFDRKLGVAFVFLKVCLNKHVTSGMVIWYYFVIVLIKQIELKSSIRIYRCLLHLSGFGYFLEFLAKSIELNMKLYRMTVGIVTRQFECLGPCYFANAAITCTYIWIESHVICMCQVDFIMSKCCRTASSIVTVGWLTQSCL